MKRTLSWILALTLVFACVFAFTSCSSFKGDYKDASGSVWHFTGNKLKIDTKLEIKVSEDKTVMHDVVAVYSYDYGMKEDGTTEGLTIFLKKYVYSGSDEIAKDQVEQMNTLLGLKTDTAKTTAYTLTRDNDGNITLKKDGSTTTTKLTLLK